MDNLTEDQRRKNMQAIRSTGTKAELLLMKTLWSLGYRYRKNNKTVFGKPDITFKKLRIAIFVDSEFFHGKDFETKKKPVNNADFWEKKIRRNMERDNEVNTHLIQSGWTVLRFWTNQIKKDLPTVIATIEHHLSSKNPIP
ncbi:very short patch repair endonuclease [Flavobacterium sp.]|uniref:very short patch repair endonuclease n=1 Tax=Flavobacterium sp. TaxID=239 RepID=UPI0026378AB6|nr:very short patch repair endonuclease [Flavobacterium sp.]